MAEYKTACRGCHGGCMHILTVEEGCVTKVRPDPDGPLNHGRACVKGMSILEQMYHPDRLTHPLRRIGPKGSGQWERITWDEALDTIAEKLSGYIRDYGAESIALISGTGRHHLSQFWRFANVLGTPNATSSGALICLGPRKNAGELCCGHFAGVDYYGDVRPGGILVWGANPAISGADGELTFLIRDAVREGIPLLVVDPKPNELTRAAKLWLPLRPGTDGALAMGILNILIQEKLYDRDFVENYTYGFDALAARCAEYGLARVAEITGLPPEKITEAAHLIASIRPLALEWGTAIEQSTNALQTCRAIFMIPALTGNYDVPGGFVESMEIAPTADILLDRLSPEQIEKCISGPYPLCNGTASPKLFAHPYFTLDAIRTGKPYPIRALLSSANNTLLSVADSRHTFDCLNALEFFVYMDFFMTPTAELADIILPAALWPEVDSVFCMPEFGDVAALCMQKVVQVGECRADEEVFLALSQRMGLDYGADSQRDILDGILAELGRRRPEYAGIDFERFKTLGWIAPEREYLSYRQRGFHTPTGKFELWSTILEKAGADPLPAWYEPPETPVSRPDMLADYPLILTTGSRTMPFFISNNRQIKSLRRQHPFPLVSMSVATAARYGIKDGQWVFIETARGRITQKAQLLADMPDGIVNCEMGWWYPEASAPGYGWDESNANILTICAPPHDPIGGAYQTRALLCKIYPNPDCRIEERYHAWINE
ncbi:MAG: molybdopterin-dependent oxidoreductase [Oscillospiraceae bacterium]